MRLVSARHGIDGNNVRSKGSLLARDGSCGLIRANCADRLRHLNVFETPKYVCWAANSGLYFVRRASSSRPWSARTPFRSLLALRTDTDHVVDARLQRREVGRNAN